MDTKISLNELVNSQSKIVELRDTLLLALCRHLPEIAPLICEDQYNHFLAQSIDNPNQVSYAAKPEYKYDAVRRVRTSLGRYLQRVYSIEITSQINQAIQTIFGEIGHCESCFEIRDDVVEVYREVAESCMSSMDCVDFYEINGVRVVVYTPVEEDKPIARALLWHTDQGQFLDRIYPNNGPHIAHYHKWAEIHGVKVRPHNKQSSDIGERYTVRNIKVGYMPYLDTLCYLTGNTLSSRGGGCCCQNTDGKKPDACQLCREWTLEEITEIDGMDVCDNCASDARQCEKCREYSFEIKCIAGQDVCESCADDCYECQICNESIWDYSRVNGKNLCEDCVERYVQCEVCGTYEVDGEQICDECSRKQEEEEMNEDVEV